VVRRCAPRASAINGTSDIKATSAYTAKEQTNSAVIYRLFGFSKGWYHGLDKKVNVLFVHFYIDQSIFCLTEVAIRKAGTARTVPGAVQ
jgi:hypothetical protein